MLFGTFKNERERENKYISCLEFEHTGEQMQPHIQAKLDQKDRKETQIQYFSTSAPNRTLNRALLGFPSILNHEFIKIFFMLSESFAMDLSSSNHQPTLFTLKLPS